MAANFLTDKDYQKLNSYPEEITREDLEKYFILTKEELFLIAKCREDFNKLGFALQLGTLKFMGFVPDSFDTLPISIQKYTCTQLDLKNIKLSDYGIRKQTKSEHFKEITDFLGFKKLDEVKQTELEQILVKSSFYHNSPKTLLVFALDWLFKEQILRIGLTTLGRLVVKCLNQADKELLINLQSTIQSIGSEKLDALLISDEETRRTKIGWLKDSATVINPEQILENLEKLEFIQNLGVLEWKLPISANKIKKMYQIAYASTNHALMNMVEFRRYPILVAYLSHSYTLILDETLDMFISYIWDCHRKGNKAFEKEIREQYSSKIELIKKLKDICELATDEDEKVLKTKYSSNDFENLISECEKYLRPENDRKWDYFAKRYSNIRKFLPKLLQVIRFESNEQATQVVRALSFIKRADDTGKRKLEDFAPVSFIDQSWDSYVYEKGEISKKYYELCTLWELREQLRRRNIYLQKSEKYCNYQEILLTDEEMSLQQDGILKSLNLSFDFSQKQKELTNNWIESVKTVVSTVKAKSKSQEQYFEIVNDEIRLKADDALDLPEGIKAFINRIKESMTVIDLPDLVMEMGTKYNFTDNLTHINNGKPTKDLEDIIKNYIVLYGNACNLTETDMERTTSLNRHQFSHHQQWYYTIDCLKKINDGLVNALYQQPLAKFWGDGTMSSSDGQKFMVSVRSIHSTANQKYFFVKKGLNSYTWTADIFAQFSSKLISATEKEATYILDMILDNETELKIEEHTGDEGAYTDLIFALFDLFGLMFCPRLGSLHKKTLLSISGATDVSKIKDIFSRPVNFALIERNWKEILRVVCSIKSGKVPCSVFVSKLQNTEQKNELLRAFQEYGKLIKTTFIMKYIVDPELRHRIRKQLNKGEGLHDLRQTIFFGNETKISKAKARDQSIQVWCLTVVTNCVILWNTLHLQKVLDKMREKGIKYDENDIIHLSPCRFEHINKYGKFTFDLDKAMENMARRELEFS